MGTSGNHKNVKYVGDSRVVVRENRRSYPKDYSEYPGKTEPFWPNFLLKEWMVGAVVLIGFLILTVSHDPPLQLIADPTDTSYYPVPDWYFLFLFELLKFTYLSGPYTILGTAAVPGLAIGALLLAPWLDRGSDRRWYKRPVASGMMFLAILALFALTYQAVQGHDWDQNERFSVFNPIHDVQIDKEHPAYEYYAQSCLQCHGENLEGTGIGVALNLVGQEHDEDYIRDVIVNGKGEMPAGMFSGTDEELDELVAWLATLDGSDQAGKTDTAGDE